MTFVGILHACRLLTVQPCYIHPTNETDNATQVATVSAIYLQDQELTR